MPSHDLSQKPIVLVVDDTPHNIALVCALLKDIYRTKVATTGEKALKIASTHPQPDIILLDIMMPEMDGFEVCRRLKENPETAGIPVIFLTAKSEQADERQGFEVGAVDYITKPISPPLTLARINTHLALKSAKDFLQSQNTYLEEEVKKRTRELEAIQNVTIMSMASLAEARDNETGNHIRRTQHYVKRLAHQVKDHPRFRDILTEQNIELIFKSAPLHDIGKIGIPDNILLKPGPLTEEEFEIMKTHTTIGRDAIIAAEKLLDTPHTFLRFAREIAYSHQEKWDGTGYPEGLSGDSIPVSARLMALADVYDALATRRVYKPAFPHDIVVTLISESKNTHFDPDLVDAFMEIADEFKAIAQQYADTEQELTEKILLQENNRTP